MPAGSLRVHKAKIMREVMTELNRVSLPPYNIMLRVADRRLSTRQTRGMSSCMVSLVVPMGRPRYVKGIFPTTQPKMFAKVLQSSSSQFIGINVDL